ncbi:hypothetical protein VTL71DRAFT_2213 [Oculimacula yallundae]|uniref:CFEM domain-containing protein n=1 Tax=Oculimacula yallundae TaxID=86028 RepID=A0ABR4C893_9HELO
MFFFTQKSYTLIFAVLSSLLQSATCQSLQETVNQIPVCSAECISSAAITYGCAATDWDCQCRVSSSFIGKVGSVIGDVSILNTGRKDCLSKSCAAAEASNVEQLLEQICRLLKGITISPVLPASTQSIAAPSTHTSSPTSVIEPSSRPEGNSPAQNSPSTQVPVTTLIAIPPEKINRTSTSQVIQSTPIPIFTLSQSGSATVPLKEASSTSSSSISSSAPMPTSQTSLTSPLPSQSVSPPPTTFISATSSARADQSYSTSQTSQTSIKTSDDSLPAASTPATKSWQAEADKSQPATTRMAEKSTKNTMSPVVIAATIFGVLVLAALFTLNLFLIRRRKIALKKKQQQRVMSAMSDTSGMSGEDITVFLDMDGQRRNDDRQKTGGWSTRTSESVRGKRVWRGHKPRVPVGEKEQELKFSFDFRSGLSSNPYAPKS